MIGKIHASIQNIHAMVGEKKAGEWEDGRKEPKADKSKKPGPVVRPKRVRKSLYHIYKKGNFFNKEPPFLTEERSGYVSGNK